LSLAICEDVYEGVGRLSTAAIERLLSAKDVAPSEQPLPDVASTSDETL